MFPVTTSLKGAAVGNVCKSLLKHGLIEEFEATDLNTVWRQDEERGPITLRATPLAYTALGIAEDTSEAAPAETATAPEPVRRRSGTKQEAVIATLRAEAAPQHCGRLDQPQWAGRVVKGDHSLQFCEVGLVRLRRAAAQTTRPAQLS